VPDRHFGTSVNDGAMPEVVLALLTEVDEELGRPDPLTLVDVGAGQGELLAALLPMLPPDRGWEPRLQLVGVDVRPRPAGLVADIEWIEGLAPGAVPSTTGLLWAHELLDDVPCDVVQLDGHGVARVVLVDEQGRESLGPVAEDATQQWLDRWWPLTAPGDRAEVGLTRDEAWAGLSERLVAGRLVAVDYAHAQADRAGGRWRGGSLLGYRDGRAVPPVPDGSCNLTAHVALDACAAATPERAGDVLTLTTQREAIAHLPDRSELLGVANPAQTLAATSRRARLRDPAGTGSFGWLELRRARG
jgi:SAM-dependent MidA family methyltransferase